MRWIRRSLIILAAVVPAAGLWADNTSPTPGPNGIAFNRSAAFLVTGSAAAFSFDFDPQGTSHTILLVAIAAPAGFYAASLKFNGSPMFGPFSRTSSNGTVLMGTLMNPGPGAHAVDVAFNGTPPPNFAVVACSYDGVAGTDSGHTFSANLATSLAVGGTKTMGNASAYIMVAKKSSTVLASSAAQVRADGAGGAVSYEFADLGADASIQTFNASPADGLVALWLELQLYVPPTVTSTATPTDSPTATMTPTSSSTPTDSPTGTVSLTSSSTPTSTPTDSPTATMALTVSPVATATSTGTGTRTATPWSTPTRTVTATRTASPAPTATPTPSPRATAGRTVSATPTATPRACGQPRDRDDQDDWRGHRHPTPTPVRHDWHGHDRDSKEKPAAFPDNADPGMSVSDLRPDTSKVPAPQPLGPALIVAPNPANQWVRLRVSLGQEGHARILMLDLTGAVVASEDLGPLPAGVTETQWPVNQLADGIYCVQVLLDRGAGAAPYARTKLAVLHR